MASIIKIAGSYYLQFYDGNRRPKRKQVSLKTKTKRVAEKVARKLEDEYALGDYDPWLDRQRQEQAERLSRLGTAIEEFLEAKSLLSPNTVRNYRERLSLFERFTGSDFPVNSISTQRVVDFLDSTDTNAVSRKNYHCHLRVFFRWLVRRGGIGKDPTTGVPLKKIPGKYPRFLMPADVDLLIQTIQDDGRRLWLIPVIQANVHLGLRRGELTNLRWSSVDLDARLITVENTDSFTTKSGKERKIPISNRAFALLKRLAEDQGASVFVFQHSEGQIEGSYLTRMFRYYRRKAGLPEHLNFHSLRHTAASWLVMNGASLEAVRRFLGHSSIQVTQKYAHLAPNVFFDQINRALNCIE